MQNMVKATEAALQAVQASRMGAPRASLLEGGGIRVSG